MHALNAYVVKSLYVDVINNQFVIPLMRMDEFQHTYYAPSAIKLIKKFALELPPTIDTSAKNTF